MGKAHHPSGWGFCAVKVSGGKTALEGGEETYSAWGPLITDPQSPLFLGAKSGTNNTAEITAMGEAFLWTKAQNLNPETAIEICFDSEYASRTMEGTYNGQSNLELYVNIRKILGELRENHRVTFTKVAAHNGHR